MGQSAKGRQQVVRIVLYFDCLRYTLGIIPFFLDNALNSLGGQ